MNTYKLLIPLGILGYIFLLLAAISGILLFKYHVKWVKLKYHIWLGILAVIMGLFHAAIVLFNR